MAKKKIVEIDDETLNNMMINDVPYLRRAHKVTEPPKAEEVSATPESEAKPELIQESTIAANSVKKQSTQQNPCRRKKEYLSDYRTKYLVKNSAPERVQTYVNRDAYWCIRRFLPVIAPGLSITSYINNILSQHLEEHRDEINEIYENTLRKPL